MAQALLPGLMLLPLLVAHSQEWLCHQTFSAAAQARRYLEYSGGCVPGTPGKKTSLWAQVGFYTSLGFILPAAVGVGLGLGWLLDRWLHTGHVLAVVLAFAGGAAGLVDLLRILTRAEKDEDTDSSHDGSGTS